MSGSVNFKSFLIRSLSVIYTCALPAFCICFVSNKKNRLFQSLNIFFIAILFLSSVKAFEREICSSESALVFQGVESGAAPENEKDQTSSDQSHLLCHQNHLCQLIVKANGYFKFNIGEESGLEFLLCPPKELFLEGPFKPPKSVS